MIKFKINNFKFIIAIICMNTINTLISTYNVYHQYSVPTILQVVTPISFLKKNIFCIVLRVKDC